MGNQEGAAMKSAQAEPIVAGQEFSIYNDNCAEALATFDSNSIDLTVTSPPYDNLRNYQGYSFDFEMIAQQLHRVTKDGGVVVWVVSDVTIDGSETGTSFRQALGFMDAGFNLHDTMIWVKKGGGAIGSQKTYRQNFEYMFVLSKGVPKAVNLIYDLPNGEYGKKQFAGRRLPDGTVRGRVVQSQRQYSRRNNWWYLINNDNHEASWHPAVFPKRLVHDHIVTWSNEGDVVLDPFMGSGTTGVVCAELSRRFVGIEISDEWAARAGERVRTAYSQLHLF